DIRSYRTSSRVFEQAALPKTTSAIGGAASMSLILRSQQAYRLENGTFAFSIAQMPELKGRLDPRYSFSIPAATSQTMSALALPMQAGLLGYSAGAFQNGDSYKTLICESNRPTLSLIAAPTLQEGKWICPKNAHPIESTGYGISATGMLLRAQQAYLLENNRFASNIYQLDVKLDNMLYRYQVAEADQRHTIVKTLARVARLYSYAGGAVQRNGQYITQICQSDQPVPTIANPVFKLGQWKCGSGSHAVP
ncbi:MAG TPA: type IV pilin-like G/H family protein, partial [Stenomitos sp.]